MRKYTRFSRFPHNRNIDNPKKIKYTYSRGNKVILERIFGMKKEALKKLMLGFFASVLLMAPVSAQNWVQIGDNHYIDAHSIKPTSAYGTYTYNTRYLGTNAPLERIGGQDIWTVKTSSYMDCRNAYAKTLSYTALNMNNRTVVSDRDIGKQWFGINNPGSRAYESYLFICTDRYLNLRPNYSPLWLY